LTGVRTAFAAISKGALDVIEKPDISLENVQTLIQKVRYLARVDVRAHLKIIRSRDNLKTGTGIPVQTGFPRIGVVAIAASAGGPQAVYSILSHLPADFTFPVVITQHISEGFTRGMVEWLNSGTPLSVVMAENGARLTPGCVYVNPSEYSMKISELGVILLGPRDASKVFHPSCDTLLFSVADSYRKTAIGLIMSGMGDDGVAGMHAIRMAGGATLAQDAESSVVYGMNRLAVERGHIHKVLPLANIAGELMQRAGLK
jgi:two-component system chemotaxis response regulator CheB